MSKKSKLYKAQIEGYDKENNYELTKGIEILQAMPHVKFDETLEVAFKLGLDPKQSDQNVRGAIPLPKGTGKVVKIAVIADGEAAEKAKEAGADFVGSEELVAKIKGGWLEFDVLIATPALMPKVRPLGRVLGPRGLMPNPKTGTVTENTEEAVAQAKAGRVEYRTDKGACVHVPFGKISFPASDLDENFQAILNAVLRAKPPTAKGVYILSCTISSTMSPSVKINTNSLVKED